MTTAKRETPLGDGLYLDNRSGSYLWRGRIAGKPASKRIRHPSGAVAKPENMTKTEARRIAKDMTADAANGTGRHFETAPRNGVTVTQAWESYWQREASALRSHREKRGHWKNFIEPAWGARPIASITKKDCATLIEQRLQSALADGEAGTGANGLQKTLKRFFAWCLDTGYGATHLERSPMDGLKSKPVDVKKTKRPPRSLDEIELGWLFRAYESYAAEIDRYLPKKRRRIVQAHECLLRSACRREDILAAKWGWLRDDGLLIPMTKMGHPLFLPLTPAMIALIGKRPEGVKDDDSIWGLGVSYLAHEIDNIREHMTAVARQDGFNGDFETAMIDGQHSPYYWTLHDFRDTCKTVLGRELREDDMPLFPREVTEAMLNHREGGVGAMYNADVASPYWMLAQRKRAGAFWDSRLTEIKNKALAEKLAA